MTGMDSQPTPRAWIRGAVLASALAFAVIYAIGVILALTAPMRMAVKGDLAQSVRSALGHPSFLGLLDAVRDLALYLGVILFQPFTVIFVYLLVEILLAGPPASWRQTVNSLVFRAINIIGGTIIAIVIARLFNQIVAAPLVEVSALSDGAGPIRVASVAAVILVVMVLDDLAFYWAHRLQHTWKPLWRFHAVHHSIENLDAANNYIHPFDRVLPVLFIALIGAVVGFRYEEFLAVSAVRVVHDHFIHSRAPIHLGRLRAVFVDNRYHHFHHSRHFEHYNKNFSEYFTLWDRVFGTCHVPADDEMVETGVRGTRQATTIWRYLTATLDSTGEDMRPAERPRARPGGALEAGE
jgi:sterol desaturase/sphingolipid hydroxylase (fatty acid hydroxylase superfamily)